jgi:ABC-type nitrate/sulfonate/bicarbonate transport system ATPase subunit
VRYDRTVLLITHREEGLELVDRVVTLGAEPATIDATLRRGEC